VAAAAPAQGEWGGLMLQQAAGHGSRLPLTEVEGVGRDLHMCHPAPPAASAVFPPEATASSSVATSSIPPAALPCSPRHMLLHRRMLVPGAKSNAVQSSPAQGGELGTGYPTTVDL